MGHWPKVTKSGQQLGDKTEGSLHSTVKWKRAWQ